MKFDTFLLPAVFLLMLGFFCVEAKRPNVLFILVDDMGAMDLSNEGSAFYESPHIDRIANEGMKFTRGYATCQVCSPSRASILTGKYPPIMESPPGLGMPPAKHGGSEEGMTACFPLNMNVIFATPRSP